MLGGSIELADSFGSSEGSRACVAVSASFAGSFSFSLPFSALFDRDLRDFLPLRPRFLSLLLSDLEDDDEDEEDELDCGW